MALFGTTWVSQCQTKTLDNIGSHTNHPNGRHSIRTNQQPTSIIVPFLCQIPFMSQPSHFILAWNRHQICWLAYPAAWLNNPHKGTGYNNSKKLTSLSVMVIWQHNDGKMQLAELPA